MYDRNPWVETADYWIYWKMKATKGVCSPNGHIGAGWSDQKDGPTTSSILYGDLISRPQFEGETELVETNDDFNVGQGPEHQTDA